MSNTRIAKWDNLKFLLMLTVVMGHTVDFYTDESMVLGWLNFFIYIFHMPAFMFVSGLFMKNTVNNKKYDRMFSYLILGFATKLFKFIANCIVGRKLKIEYFNEDSIAWYAFAVFVFALIALMPKAKTFISTIGSRTLPIYALHTSVITLLRGFGMDSLLIGLFGVNYVYAIPVAAVLILVVTSLKPFAIMIDKIINPPLSAERVDKQ